MLGSLIQDGFDDNSFLILYQFKLIAVWTANKGKELGNHRFLNHKSRSTVSVRLVYTNYYFVMAIISSVSYQ
jgi:hypothetical protein